MADMKRTTGGLFQGTQRTVTRSDLKDAVEFLDARVKNDSVRRALGLDVARKYANTTSSTSSLSSPREAGEIQDLQRVSSKR